MSVVKFYCSICDKKRRKLFVAKSDEGKTLLVCDRCLARIKAQAIYKKQGKFVNFNVPVKTKVKGNRMVVVRRIMRKNSNRYKLTYYENGEKVGYQLLRHKLAKERHKRKFLEEGVIMDTKAPKPVKEMTEGRKNQLKYIREYNKTHYKAVYLQLHIEKDKDMLEDLLSAPSKNELLRKWYEAYKEKEKGN